MERRDSLRKIIAGAFFLTGIMLIVFVVLIIGVERGLTEKRFNVEVLFTNVGGLAQGAPVNLSGVNVGTVDAIDFLDAEINGRGVSVKLNIFKKYSEQLSKATRFAIKTAGVLGEKTIEISRDTNQIPVDLDEPIIGEDPLDVQDLAMSFGETALSLQEASKQVNSIIKEIRNISITTKRLINRVEQRIIDGNLFKVF